MRYCCHTSRIAPGTATSIAPSASGMSFDGVHRLRVARPDRIVHVPICVEFWDTDSQAFIITAGHVNCPQLRVPARWFGDQCHELLRCWDIHVTNAVGGTSQRRQTSATKSSSARVRGLVWALRAGPCSGRFAKPVRQSLRSAVLTSVVRPQIVARISGGIPNLRHRQSSAQRDSTRHVSVHGYLRRYS